MFKKIIVSLVLLFSWECTASAKTPSHSQATASISENHQAKIEDLTIVVSSCGKYSDCWEPFCKLLFKYWPSLKTYNNHIKIIFITTEKDFAYEGVDVLKIDKDIAWSNNMIDALKRVKTKYVLYMQEDYMLSQPVNERRMNELLQGMKGIKAAYIQLTDDDYAKKVGTPYPALPGTVLKGKHQYWRASLRCALWETDLFMWLLRPGENPWAFESTNGSLRSEGVREPFLACSQDDPIPVENVCYIGYWMREGLAFLEKEGVPVKNPTLPIYEEYPFTHWLRAHSKFFFKVWEKLLNTFDPSFQKVRQTHIKV